MSVRVWDYRMALYCGEKLRPIQRWHRRYGWFRRTSSGFSLGPILFWHDPYRVKVAKLGGAHVRVTTRRGKMVMIETWTRIPGTDGYHRTTLRDEDIKR